MLEANKKQFPLKSYSLKIRIDFVNQISKNKEKVTQTRIINIMTRITDRKIPCVYIHVYQMIKNQRLGPYNFLRHADNRKYFSGLSVTRTCFTWRGNWDKYGHVLAEGKVSLLWLMNLEMVKPEQFDHLHLGCRSTVLLLVIFHPKDGTDWCFNWRFPEYVQGSSPDAGTTIK